MQALTEVCSYPFRDAKREVTVQQEAQPSQVPVAPPRRVAELQQLGCSPKHGGHTSLWHRPRRPPNHTQPTQPRATRGLTMASLPPASLPHTMAALTAMAAAQGGPLPPAGREGSAAAGLRGGRGAAAEPPPPPPRGTRGTLWSGACGQRGPEGTASTEPGARARPGPAPTAHPTAGLGGRERGRSGEGGVAAPPPPAPAL